MSVAVVRRVFLGDHVVTVLLRRVLDEVLVPGVLDVRLMVMVLVRVMMVVRVRLDVSVQQQQFTGDHGDQREHDEDLDFRQYDAQHAGEQGTGRGQVALDPSAF